jgi:hypothetical protein
MNTDLESVTEFARRLAALPPFEPGRIITVPLGLWPAYQAKYGLVPNGVSALGNLKVKRESHAQEMK